MELELRVDAIEKDVAVIGAMLRSFERTADDLESGFVDIRSEAGSLEAEIDANSRLTSTMMPRGFVSVIATSILLKVLLG
ncbi:MAG: hypothetical protein NZ733_01355 [Aigarchaeota archaeon]|nr:hypothetical protein [Aigarchaeota archaeon]MCX8203307.1 hypothetical protein [Nitrososphaeria archaeon]MDW8043732.1 hypothetical protein [Nitrososphaerota archaeon]